MMSCRCRLFVVLLLFFAVSGCSFKTYYNHIDYLVYDYIDDLVTLNESQNAILEQRLEAFLDWHRTAQLNQYSEWLVSVKQDVDKGMTGEQVLAHIHRLEKFWIALQHRANAEIIRLLPLLENGQIDELFANLAESNEEFRQEYIDLDSEERLNNYYETLLDNLENWLGELNENQQRMVKNSVKDVASSAETRLQQRLRWQQGVREILLNKSAPEQKQESLGRFIDTFDKHQDEVLVRKMENNKKVIANLLARLSTETSDVQKSHFRSRVDDYIHMFSDLAGERQ